MDWLAHYWWLVILANSSLGLLWVYSVGYTQWWEKALMITTGAIGFAVAFVFIIVRSVCTDY